MQKHLRIWCFTVLCLCCSQNLFTQDKLATIPEFSLKTLDGAAATPAIGSCQVIYFFDASLTKHKPALQVLNQLAYTFRMRNVQVAAVYSDFERLDKQEVAKLQEETSLLFPIYLDEGRQVLRKFQIKAAPAVFVADPQNALQYTNNAASLDFYEIKKNIELALGFIDKDSLGSYAIPSDSFVPDAAGQIVVADTERIAKSELVPTQPEPVSKHENQPLANNDKKPDPTTPTPDNTVKPVTSVNNNPDPATTTNKPGDKVVPPANNPAKVDNTVAQANAQPDTRSAIPLGLDPGLFATIAMNDTLGYKPVRLGLSHTVEDFMFFLVVDLWVKLIPLMIWGWGMLYTLSKLRRYQRMFYGFIGCFGLFAWNVWSLSMQIPYEICLLTPEIAYWKSLCFTFYQMLQNAVPMATAYSGWQPEIVMLSLFQCAVVIGLAGRCKQEQAAVA